MKEIATVSLDVDVADQKATHSQVVVVEVICLLRVALVAIMITTGVTIADTIIIMAAVVAITMVIVVVVVPVVVGTIKMITIMVRNHARAVEIKITDMIVDDPFQTPILMTTDVHPQRKEARMMIATDLTLETHANTEVTIPRAI